MKQKLLVTNLLERRKAFTIPEIQSRERISSNVNGEIVKTENGAAEVFKNFFF